MPRTTTTATPDAKVLAFLNQKKTAAAEAKAAYIAQGYIDCSVPGCDGLVNPSYIEEFQGLKVGICPRRDQHKRLGF
jgi:hypothetical protein